MNIEIMKNEIIQGDCLEILKSFPDNSVDAVVTDPPYGIGIKDWDSEVAIHEFLKEAKRISRGFIVFFGQFPTMAKWLIEAERIRLHPLEHVTWVKRNEVPVHKHRLTRTHEEIFFYGVKGAKTFHQVKGAYSDVKPPGLLFETTTIEGIKRRLSYFETWAKTGVQPIYKHNNQHQEWGGTRLKCNSTYSNLECNFSNAWSFLPPTQTPGRRTKGEYYHPCEKPVEVMKRILEMTVKPGGIVCDPFCGSGSTLLAAIDLEIDYIGIEQNPEYIATAHRRIASIEPKQMRLIG